MELIVVPAVVGTTEFVKRLFDKDYRAAVIILVAAVVGGVLGANYAPAQLDVVTGVLAGLAASGVVTVAQKVSTTKKA